MGNEAVLCRVHPRLGPWTARSLLPLSAGSPAAVKCGRSSSPTFTPWVSKTATPNEHHQARLPACLPRRELLGPCMSPGFHLPDGETSLKGTRDWPHAPPHRLGAAGVYFLTARSMGGRHLLADDGMKDWFQKRLFQLAGEFGWKLEAWAILSNHYHLIAHSPKVGGGPWLQWCESSTVWRPRK
jgi:hypothetical protein